MKTSPRVDRSGQPVQGEFARREREREREREPRKNAQRINAQERMIGQRKSTARITAWWVSPGK
jgi:hypothetical protein